MLKNVGGDVGEDAKVQDWFRRIRASESAKTSYTKGMQYFMDFAKEKGLITIGNTPKEFLEYAKQKYKTDALDWKDEIEGIIAEYEEWLTQKPKIYTKGGYGDTNVKLAPKTINTYIAAIRSFLGAFNIEVPKAKKRRQPKTLEANNHRLTKEIVRESLKYADVRAKAIITIMLSGGLDDSGILNLKVGDFIRGRGYEPSQVGDLNVWIGNEKRKCEAAINEGDFEGGITQLSIRRQKTGVDYITFVTPEATLAVLDYLAWRNRPTSYSERYKGIGKIREEKRKSRSPVY
jgi:integrase